MFGKKVRKGTIVERGAQVVMYLLPTVSDPCYLAQRVTLSNNLAQIGDGIEQSQLVVGPQAHAQDVSVLTTCDKASRAIDTLGFGRDQAAHMPTRPKLALQKVGEHHVEVPKKIFP